EFAWDDTAGDWRTLHPAALDAPGAVVVPDAPFTLAGNAAAAFGAQLPAVAQAAAVDGDAMPHALAVAHAALRAYRAGRTVPAEAAAPEYVRDKVAQTTAERMAARAAQAGGAKE
ncbi:tRNA (adenosine(37)-N6)-threonylcarbamoyltransferase complex dimerization subunit type 1 TsaB, partial [Burkholderia sp. Ac-20353]|nr:tRNA (adenosine(37)-N6)-threonylcarbamoyltransferase complex dimerization subunit type 1 TsaB [Burkholderia sp. Ac-20353]